MADEAEIILSTSTPEFSDGGDFLLCQLTSRGRTWAFGIPWHATELAMQRCGAVLEEHRAKARNVAPFSRRKGRSLPHG